MQRLTRCPCCDAALGRTVPAVLAPFIRERLGIKDSTTAELSDCGTCGFRCFVDRYEPSEIQSLYGGYRGETYFRQRHRHEPWYTRRFNDDLGSPEAALHRNHRLASFLREAGVLPAARSVIDWGGDRGQFIPETFSERFVYDISGVQPVPSVTALRSDDLRNRRYDLLIAAHVLEHASDPAALLRELLEIRASRIYVEVPYEPVRLPSHMQTSAWYHRWVHAVAGSRWYLPIALVSTAARVKRVRFPPFGVLQQHEHLNYFEEATLVRLLERVGCRVVRVVSYRRNSGSGPVEAIGALAIPPGLNRDSE